MKKSKLLIAGIFFALSFLAYTPAHATTTTTTQSSSIWDGLSDWWNSIFGGGSGSGSGSGSTSGSGSSSSGSTSLPINNNVWFLVAAGTVVGCTVIMKASKRLATQKI
ncbi:hypothetical protein [Mucilaginibacter sp. L3T2-6]|uniref:hypothetical protein n=1 Tax=Mucilaginibacter sp. L3T2-6 TaxID=3062491 RepID=UPI002676F571|nr:hypothetical protein [Mucilaginibacter sp. L3T2-6]MDO3644232.1 hypothetical protein [Mucilaginibacter sp. L3T2-6]MDV6216671.1 hypothetical protein [Mucilaginibacter sp. L3T2-6]